MAAKTDDCTGGRSRIYSRQRSNSDPRPNQDVFNGMHLNTDKQKNGEMKSGSLGANTPPPERKSKFAALGRLFRPWKWKRKKKSDKIEKTAKELERKISIRSTRDDLIKKGVLKENDDQTPVDAKSGDGAGDSVTTQASVPHATVELEAIKESKDDDKSDSKQSDKPSENGSAPSAIDDEDSGLTEPTSITTQAEITPTSTCSSSGPVLSAAQIRPIIIPTAETTAAQIRPIIIPTEVITAARVSPREVTPQPPPLVKDPQPTENLPLPQPEAPVSSSRVKFEDESQNTCINDLEQQVEESKQEEENRDSKNDPQMVLPPGPYEAIPAKEPDLTKQPKRSALKSRMEYSNNVDVSQNGDVSHTPTSEGSTRSYPSPNSTPCRPNIRQPRTRIGFVVPNGEEDTSTSQPLPPPPPPPPPEQNGDDYSDSEDEEIHYRDDDNSLAAKVARQDSLARFLSNRPTRTELVEKNIIPSKSEEEKQVDKHQIGSKLIRRLSLRPTQDELEQRNILHVQSTEDAVKKKEEMKRYLVRKLSFRPSVEELRERKIIKFSDYVEVTSAHEYDRKADKPWTRLTPKDKAVIRKELNEFKSREMDVHEESRHLTRFHRP
ncbi:hypothetical protein ScPMuIL_006065 [Solemya velum]